MDGFSQMAFKYGYLVVAFVVGGGIWWFSAPYVVRKTNPRLRRHNLSHYHRVVRFYRAWGLAAVVLGILLVYSLGADGWNATSWFGVRR